MPRVEVRFFKDDRGDAPVREWLEGFRRSDPRAFSTCQARIRLLAEFGFELRRPYADPVRGGIHELRIRHRRAQLRILYFFHGRTAVVLTHALQKEARIPELDIARAIARRHSFEADPTERTDERRWEDA